MPRKLKQPEKEEKQSEEQPQKTKVQRPVHSETIMEVIKQEFQKANPKADENGIGAGFFKSDIFDVDEESQNEYFNLLKNLFTSVNIRKPQLGPETFAEEYYDVLETVTEMAVCGCVPAMDYLCFIYKKGVDDVMPVNLVRAHEWGLLATACGSKLSPERLRMFLDPVYSYVIEKNLVDGILRKYNAKSDEDLINYIAYNFANIFNEKQNLTLGGMSKKRIITTESFQVFLKKASQIRNDCLPILEKYIA